MGRPRFLRHVAAGIAIAATIASFGLAPAGHSVALARGELADTSSCSLGPNGTIHHVIYVQFDNVHFSRDVPNVPSDLEQMPHLLNFIKSNGTMFTQNHTSLIAHTANDLVTSYTGLYPSRHGLTVSNSYDYYDASGVPHYTSAFKYWTALIGDGKYNLITNGQRNTPAPWVPYTRTGCSFGAAAGANIAPESGPTTGVAIHCARIDSLCANGTPDLLPDEPGGYTGYMGLFGHSAVAGALGGITTTDGTPITQFPGFDGMTPAYSLGYVLAMQEHGVPVTYAYISDAHDNHSGDEAYGPGEAGYEAQLRAYDQAFGQFFTRLAQDGITPANTLFVFSADENDHFVGSQPSPSNCDGINIPCTYSAVGEINANMDALLQGQGVNTTTEKYDIHFDSAPTFYLYGQPSSDNPVTRQFEHAVANMSTTNLITGQQQRLTNYLADQVEENILHMVNSDPNRTPTFTMFANPDYYFQIGSLSGCNPNYETATFCVNPGHAWNHGDVSPDINTTWLGLAGPGVLNEGVNGTTWLDQTDVRPTMMVLLGLHDDYQHDGRVLYEDISPSFLSEPREPLIRLAQVYKQLNAAVGQFGLDSLAFDTKIVESYSSEYTMREAQLQQFGEERDQVAAQISNLLEGVEFNHERPSPSTINFLTSRATSLLGQMHRLAQS